MYQGGTININCQETYEIGSEENKINYNIWLPEEVLPGFRPFMTEFYWKLNESARAILDALMMGMDLTPDESENVRKLHTGHNNQLRLAHYLPISVGKLDDDDMTRLAAHTDWRSVTSRRSQSVHS